MQPCSYCCNYGPFAGRLGCGQQGTEWSHESADTGSYRDLQRRHRHLLEHPATRSAKSWLTAMPMGFSSITSSDGQSLSFPLRG